MDLENINTSFEETLQEVQTMRLSDDENVLRCYSSFVQADKLWLVTQLMDKGSCCRVMSLAKAQGFGEGMNEEWLAYILKESLQGLRYLHEHGQIHRDIKGGNILLDSSGGVRLADFGVSGWTLSRGERKGSVKTFVGTPCWMAPEVMEQVEGYDSRADIWSIGITALELAKGYAPYARLPPMRVLLLTIEEEPPSLRNYPDNKQRTGAPFSRYFTDFVQKCLSKNPK
jgi:serine/threonine-protein kinase OSR1/STK39